MLILVVFFKSKGRTGARGRAELWPYVFVLGGGRVDHAKALDARRWTEVVQAVLKRQAGVRFAPKDLCAARSSPSC